MIVSPWLLALLLVLSTLTIFSIWGLVAAIVPLSAAIMTFLGSRDLLGPFQPAYALVDTQISLLVASTSLLLGKGSATWEVDEELRNQYT